MLRFFTVIVRPAAAGLCGLLLGLLPAVVTAAESARLPLTASERLRLPVPAIATQALLPRFGEGVVFDGDGRLYVSDPFDNAILEIADDGAFTVWSREVTLPNGHKVLPNGTHVVMEGGGQGAVVLLDANGRLLRRLTHDDHGRRLRWPNDVTLDNANGGFYFTDPGEFMADQPGRVYYANALGQIITVSDGEIAFPNGIVLRPGGRTLLIAESLQNRVVQLRVRGPGRAVGKPRPFARLPSVPNPWTNGEAEPDGMALDSAGRLYVAHFGAGLVRVFDRRGRLLGSLATGSSSITNLAFGGAGRASLFVYAALGKSLDEFALGGEIVRLTLPGVSGLDLLR